MISKFALSLRMVPTTVLLTVIVGSAYLLDQMGSSFDFWAKMVNFPADLLSWGLTGSFVVLFFLLLGLVRANVTRISFGGLGALIPQTDSWEDLQFKIILLNIIVPIFIGLIFSFEFLSSANYILLLFSWMVANFLPDYLYYLYWMIPKRRSGRS